MYVTRIMYIIKKYVSKHRYVNYVIQLITSIVFYEKSAISDIEGTKV